MSDNLETGEHEGIPIVIWINPKATRVGPELTDLNGDLDHKVKRCPGCRHFGIHDYHYFYCSAQYAENQKADAKYAYPWRGAGKHFSRWPDAAGCPHDKEQDENAVNKD
jgi:hypothetical protein